MDDFMCVRIEWEQDRIQWFVDGIPIFLDHPSTIPAGKQWVFNKSFFVILECGGGGRWPGSPNTSDEVPQRMLVDYVRVYQRTTAPAPRVRLGCFGPLKHAMASRLSAGVARSVQRPGFALGALEDGWSPQRRGVHCRGDPQDCTGSCWTPDS